MLLSVEEKRWIDSAQSSPLLIFGVPGVALVVVLFIGAFVDLYFWTSVRSSVLGWQNAETIASKEAYQDFLNEQPFDRFAVRAGEAILKIELAEEKAAWNNAAAVDTMSAYKRFVSIYPNSSNRSSAENRLTEIAWDDALDQNTEDAFLSYAESYPSSKFLTSAMERAAQSAWRDAKLRDKVESYENYFIKYRHTSGAKDAAEVLVEGQPLRAFLKFYSGDKISRSNDSSELRRVLNEALAISLANRGRSLHATNNTYVHRLNKEQEDGEIAIPVIEYIADTGETSLSAIYWTESGYRKVNKSGRTALSRRQRNIVELILKRRFVPDQTDFRRGVILFVPGKRYENTEMRSQLRDVFKSIAADQGIDIRNSVLMSFTRTQIETGENDLYKVDSYLRDNALDVEFARQFYSRRLWSFSEVGASSSMMSYLAGYSIGATFYRNWQEIDSAIILSELTANYQVAEYDDVLNELTVYYETKVLTPSGSRAVLELLRVFCRLNKIEIDNEAAVRGLVDAAPSSRLDLEFGIDERFFLDSLLSNQSRGEIVVDSSK